MYFVFQNYDFKTDIATFVRDTNAQEKGVITAVALSQAKGIPLAYVRSFLKDLHETGKFLGSYTIGFYEFQVMGGNLETD